MAKFWSYVWVALALSVLSTMLAVTGPGPKVAQAAAPAREELFSTSWSALWQPVVTSVLP